MEMVMGRSKWDIGGVEVIGGGRGWAEMVGGGWRWLEVGPEGVR
jgi:hypothetical protein